MAKAKKSVAKKSSKKKDPNASTKAMFARMDSAGETWCKMTKGKNKGKRSAKSKC